MKNYSTTWKIHAVGGRGRVTYEKDEEEDEGKKKEWKKKLDKTFSYDVNVLSGRKNIPSPFNFPSYKNR